MTRKLFLLGLPGSGKSTVARKIKEKYTNLSIQHISDYDILYAMFQKDTESKGGKFAPTKYGGFDVLDFSILDLALQKMEREVVKFIHPTKKAELIIYFQFVFIIRRIRLVVRTRDSQSRNRGSIPLCATKNSRDEG